MNQHSFHKKIIDKLLYQAAELTFLVSLGLYLLFLAAKSTTFNLNLKWTQCSWLRILLIASGLLRLFQLIIQDRLNRAFLIRITACSIIEALVWVRIFQKSQYEFIPFLAILTVCSIGFDYRKILKLYVFITGLTVMTAVICALSGSIVNLVYLQNSVVRSAWGICYTTDFASYLLFLNLIGWVAFPNYSDRLFLIPGIIAMILSIFICHSYTSAFCLLIFCLFIIINSVKKGVIHSFLFSVLPFSFTFCCLFMLFLEGSFRKGFPFALRLNSLLHDRLSLASDTYDLYGLTLFGTPFQQSGSGRTVFLNPDYQFVDCSYYLILLRYGIIILVIISLLWFLITRSAKKMQDFRLAATLSVIAIHAISEHHFTELNYNIFLILPFSIIYYSCIGDHAEIQADFAKSEKLSDYYFLIYTGVILLLILFPLRPLLSAFRTLCNIAGMKTGVYHQRALFLTAYIFLGLAVLFLHAFSKSLLAFFQKRKPFKVYLLILALGLAGCIGMLIIVSCIFYSASKKNRDVMNEEKVALEILESCSDSRFCVDDVPAIYALHHIHLKHGFLGGEDLVRLKNISLITDIHSDYTTLIRRGFLFTPISKIHALYTNSESVMSAFKEKGFHFTGYFPTEESVMLKQLARKNQLELTHRGVITDYVHPIKKCPYLSLSESDYTVRFYIHSIECTAEDNPDSFLAKIRVYSQKNNETIINKTIIKEKSHDTDYVFEFTMSIPDSNDIGFELLPQDGCTLTLSALTYQKTPPYDTHNTYDRKGRIEYQSFYDLNGNPYKGDWGYEACKYSYDQNGNRTQISYYDSNGTPTLIDDGYSIVRFGFNEKKQLIFKGYYDASDIPVSLKSGYSSVDLAYDKAGNCIEKNFYDINRQPVMTAWGYARQCLVYDANARIIREKYYDVNNDPCKIRLGYAAIERVFDENGNLLTEKYFDENDLPCLYHGKYAFKNLSYDKQNRVILEAFFGINNEPVLLPEGYHSISTNYDDSGNRTIQKYYDLAHNPVNISAGYATIIKTYENNHLIKEEFFDKDGNSV